jgi:tetratricopeptide (TPR) repeat protein
MAQTSTRITRKKIRQPDRFLTLTGQALDFCQQHKKRLLLGFAALLFLALAWAGWSFYRDRQEGLAAREYEQALALFRGGKFREALPHFTAVDSYRSSRLRGFALLYLAHSHLALNENDKAVRSLESLLSYETRLSVLRQLAWMTLGYAHEARGQWTDAARAYGEAQKLGEPYAADALLSKARCEMEAKEYAAALQSYRSYLDTYPNAARSMEASLKAQELGAKMKAKTG